MQIRLLITGCLLALLCGCVSIHSQRRQVLVSADLMLDADDRALSESLAHFGQGLIFLDTDGTDSDRVAAELKAVLQNVPDNHELSAGIAMLALSRGLHELAVDVMEISYSRKPNSFRRCTDLADMYQLTGHPRKALAQYHKALQLDSSKTDLYAIITQIELSQGSK